jgi:hypothetical protein
MYLFLPGSFDIPSLIRDASNGQLQFPVLPEMELRIGFESSCCIEMSLTDEACHRPAVIDHHVCWGRIIPTWVIQLSSPLAIAIFGPKKVGNIRSDKDIALIQ